VARKLISSVTEEVIAIGAYTAGLIGAADAI